MNKKFYGPFFKGKKITIMGIDPIGRGVQVAKLLAECGAKITVTDLKDKYNFVTSLKKLAKYKISFVLGEHRLEDFENTDLVIKAASTPLASPYINHARFEGVEIAMDASLFARLVQGVEPKITLIGITGTRGKSMTAALIYHILKSNEKILGGKVYLGGNMRGKATLPLIKKVRPGDFVVLELDSWQCQGFGDEKISPHIAIFTNLMPDHMNYYKNDLKRYLDDKTNIYKFQNKEDLLITNKKLLKILPHKPKGRVILPIPQLGLFASNILGIHNIQNIAYAVEVTRAIGLKGKEIKRALKTFPGLEGRLEYVGKKKGANIINDNNSTTPEATTAGIEAVSRKYKKGNIILICGGADKGLDLEKLSRKIEQLCTKVTLLPGTGTERLKKELRTKFIETMTLVSAVNQALKVAKGGDVILFSPGFASFGLFKNEYDRNDQFLKIIRNKRD